jgi:hypothetical protein
MWSIQPFFLGFGAVVGGFCGDEIAKRSEASSSAQLEMVEGKEVGPDACRRRLDAPPYTGPAAVKHHDP